jgi:hypothetical protein
MMTLYTLKGYSSTFGFPNLYSIFQDIPVGLPAVLENVGTPN